MEPPSESRDPFPFSEMSDNNIWETLHGRDALQFFKKNFALYKYTVKKGIDWVKKCMEYEVEGSRLRGRPKRTWKEVVQKDCKARNLNKEDAMDRGRWKKSIKTG